MTMTMCETPVVAAFEASEQLKAAVDAERQAKAAYDSALAALYDAIATEVAAPNRPADVARYLGYHPGHVRRIAKARGVAPFIDVEPPRRRKAEPTPD